MSHWLYPANPNSPDFWIRVRGNRLPVTVSNVLKLFKSEKTDNWQIVSGFHKIVRDDLVWIY